MGKPFGKELQEIDAVVEWSSTLNTDKLSEFLFEEQRSTIIVGSGGSISAAHLLSALLRLKGKIGQVLTPLELYYAKESIKNEQLVLLSASGRNKDIRFGLRTALYTEPASIGCLTMSINNPLLDEAKKYSICNPFGYEIPTGKDGFLATNSLIATWVILLKAFGQHSTDLTNSFKVSSTSPSIDSFLASVDRLRTLIVLYGRWGQPAAIDIESKCTEAGLVNVQIADYRNFGHGRHHWIAKHPLDTAVVALTSHNDSGLCEQTLQLLPASIPKLSMVSKFEEPLAYLDLLIQSFSLIEALGHKMGIDPGKPGVPEFGRKLYHINPSTTLKLPILKTIDLAVRRKLRRINQTGLELGKEDEIFHSLPIAERTFIKSLKTTKFSSLIVDYDGTICAKERRFSDLSEVVVKLLVTHLENGFLIGIATGRGRSVQHSLKKVIPQILWEQVIIGYYNGTIILPLSADLPGMEQVQEPVLKELEAVIRASPYKYLPITSRTYQLTITTSNESTSQEVMSLLNSYLQLQRINTAIVLTSGSSVDVIVNGSKTNVIKHCQQLAESRQIPGECLCIGDKGNYPGNDFDLLASPFSLSVDEVSADLKTCWNLSGLGVRNEQAFIDYLSRITYHSHFFKIEFSA